MIFEIIDILYFTVFFRRDNLNFLLFCKIYVSIY